MGAMVFPLTISFENLKLSPVDLIMHGLKVFGSGIAPTASTRAMLRFAAKQGIKPIVKLFPMTQEGVVEAMAKLREGKMRYRGVLVAA